MKKYCLLITIISLTSFLINAQNDYFSITKNTNISDKSIVKLRNTEVLITSKKEKSDLETTLINNKRIGNNEKSWTIVGLYNLGLSGYLFDNKIQPPKTLKKMELDYSRSNSIGIDFMLKGIDLFKTRMYLSPGVGFNWNKYHFKDRQLSITTQNDTLMFVIDSAINYKSYKLRTAYLQVPLLIGLRLGNLNKNTINIQFGAIAGYNIGTITKEKFAIKGVKYNNKIKDNYNINPFKLEAVANVSFGNIGVFGRYSFTSLFEKNKAPTVSPFALGLTFGSL